jgi:F-type H+-transporting ATPase subunit epsilon
MASTFPLQLVTPTGVVYQGEAAQVMAANPLGEFGVLAEHVNFITSLVPCVLEIRLADGTAHHYVIAGGLAEVKDGAMTVLADSAEEPQAINRTVVEGELEAAEAKISQMSAYAADYEGAHHDVLLARARIRGTELRPSAH